MRAGYKYDCTTGKRRRKGPRRHARRRLSHQSRPGYVKSFKTYFFYLLFPAPPASREQGRALHDRNKAGEPHIMHARAKRKRSRAAAVTGKTDDTLACLRGPVSGNAEKEKDRVLHEKVLDVQDPCFFGRLFVWPPLHALLLFIFYTILPTLQRIVCGSCCFQIYGFLMPCDGMPDGVLREDLT